MKNSNRSRKAKFLATTGCVVVGLGLYYLPTTQGENDGGNGKKWYRSISQVDAQDPLRAANRDSASPDIKVLASAETPVSNETDQVNAGKSARRVVAPAQEPARAVPKEQARVQQAAVAVAPDQPVAQPAAYQVAATVQPKAKPAVHQVAATVQPRAKPAAYMAMTDQARFTELPDSFVSNLANVSQPALFNALWMTASADAQQQPATPPVPATKRSRDRTAKAKPASVDPREVVRIIPASGHDLAGKDAEAQGDEDKKWYSSFWPLGTRVGVAKLRDDYIPFQTEKSDKKAAKQGLNKLPNRPNLLVELGDGFLDTGNLHPGFEVPVIGAVWQPRLWTYLINRTTIQSFDNGFSGNERETEIANRLDLFFNLQLTGTEKILLGLRPTDKNRPSDFTKYTIDGSEKGFNPDFRLGLETLFFEGDLGSLFPVFDQAGFIPLDFGFTVGRQPLIFQEGILINDTIDAFGLIRNNIPVPGTSNFRVSGIWGFNRTDRNDGRGGDEQLFGLFTAADTHTSTWNLDLIYIYDPDKSGDGLYAGLSAIQRLPGLGGISTAFRVNASYAPDGEVPGNVVGDGVLLTSEISKTVHGSDDIVYFNSFLNIGNFTQAGREAINGGPLANTGILFASPNLSTYLAEIDPFTSDDVVGGAIGYQAFWDDKRRNLILEIAGRKDLSGDGFDSLGYGFQLQQAVGRHVQLQLEGFYTINEDNDDGSGARAEILFVL